jgi:hypothetical protein
MYPESVTIGIDLRLGYSLQIPDKSLKQMDVFHKIIPGAHMARQPFAKSLLLR